MNVCAQGSNEILPTEVVEISVKGKPAKVPCLEVGDARLVVLGGWCRTAQLRDEEYVEYEAINRPKELVEALRKARMGADVLKFSEKPPQSEVRFPYRAEWHDAAVIPITSYDEWWEKRVTQVTRKNVRRSRKRGVTTKVAVFDDELVRGIMSIYNESPVRQGREFWHYGKGFEDVKRENATYRDQCDFVAAMVDDELIGFIKLVYVGKLAVIMQIISMGRHEDKRPTNALLDKAVEVCAANGTTHLIYGKYTYGNEGHSSLAEFKRRNGFEPLRVPTYFVPVTLKGRLYLALGLHRSLRERLPEWLVRRLLRWRAQWHFRKKK